MQTLIDLTASIVTAHLANNRIAASEVPAFLTEVHATLTALTASEGNLNATARPALSAQPQLVPEDRASNNETARSAQPATAADAGEPPAATATPAAPIPAVEISDSVQPDHIVCLEEGENVVLLKRHLRTNHQMTPAQYRRRWNLPTNYPMVSPKYAEQKRKIALKDGFGKTVRPLSRGGVLKVGVKPASDRVNAKGPAAPPAPDAKAATTVPAPVKGRRLKPAFASK